MTSEKIQTEASTDLKAAKAQCEELRKQLLEYEEKAKAEKEELELKDKRESLEIKISFIISFILFFITFCFAVKDLADYSSWNIAEQATALLIVLTKLFGAVLSGMGASDIIVSFIMPDEETRTKGVVMFLAGTMMIFIKSVLGNAVCMPIQ